ncbi:hypothetical protein VN1218_03640 [Helicobacter pylori]|nr:hypothetical protein VN1218_03640 [Helicobacter pylori]
MSKWGFFTRDRAKSAKSKKKKKKIFMGLNVKFLLSFFCFYYLILAFLLA